MARYTGAVCRLCRREGMKLYLKGDRCYSDKCAFVNKQSAPGQHGTSRKKVSEYGMQLREKQKVKRIYGVEENQFRLYYDKASRQNGVTGENLLRLLERKMDGKTNYIIYGSQSDSKASIKIEKEEGVPRD